MKTLSLGIYFLIKKHKINKHGEVPIHVRITVNSKPIEISIRRHITPESWNDEKQCVRGNVKSVQSLNSYINTVKNNLLHAHGELVKENKIITARAIKQRYLGVDEEYKTLLEVVEYHNTQMKAKLGIEAKYGTYKNYRTTLKYLKEFIPRQFKGEDIYLKQLNHKFISDFEFFLTTIKSCKNNGAVKHLQRLKKIINVAIRNEWLSFDPFARYRMKIKKSEPKFLNQEELDAIENTKLIKEQQRVIRDIFVFSCYTGFAYADVKKFTPDDIIKGIDGQEWIYTHRSKTEIKSNVPLLPKALEIIKKYKAHPTCISNNVLLPILSNQKTNIYLKEIAWKKRLY